MKVIKPDSEDQECNSKSIFLAGSIEMGLAEDWQRKTSELFKDSDVTFFNPRRDGWDSTWTQEKINKEFANQVNWEMDSLDSCDIIFMNIIPGTKSPITLLELGLHANSKKIIVCCPDGFWRKGNVEIVCSRHKIPLHDNIEDAMSCLASVVTSELINKL
jgi:nucleoside 2-deoxyribosyltransferase